MQGVLGVSRPAVDTHGTSSSAPARDAQIGEPCPSPRETGGVGVWRDGRRGGGPGREGAEEPKTFDDRKLPVLKGHHK